MNPPPAPRYLAVEGPIGAGKTSLARRLAERFGAELLLEDPAANPFLERFYRDMARYALPTQLFFLFERVRQLRPLAQTGLFDRPVVADFLLEKDALFARLTLPADELALYQRVHDALGPQAPAPDLVVALHAPVRTLAERVRRRAAAWERGVTEDYLARLAEAYARFFHHYTGAPVLIVNSEKLDFVDRDSDLDRLVERIRGMKSRREYFDHA